MYRYLLLAALAITASSLVYALSPDIEALLVRIDQAYPGLGVEMRGYFEIQTAYRTAYANTRKKIDSELRSDLVNEQDALTIVKHYLSSMRYNYGREVNYYKGLYQAL